MLKFVFAARPFPEGYLLNGSHHSEPIFLTHDGVSGDLHLEGSEPSANSLAEGYIEIRLIGMARRRYCCTRAKATSRTCPNVHQQGRAGHCNWQRKILYLQTKGMTAVDQQTEFRGLDG